LESVKPFKYGLIGERFASMKTRANAKGQIVIPAILRRKYGIKEGTRIFISDNGDSIVLKPITEKYLQKLQGSLKGAGALKMLLHEKLIESRKNG
jgi:AbrB family looped-hinge helix DNA binding protein